jgi:hypothetical protein
MIKAALVRPGTEPGVAAESVGTISAESAGPLVGDAVLEVSVREGGGAIAAPPDVAVEKQSRLVGFCNDAGPIKRRVKTRVVFKKCVTAAGAGGPRGEVNAYSQRNDEMNSGDVCRRPLRQSSRPRHEVDGLSRTVRSDLLLLLLLVVDPILCRTFPWPWHGHPPCSDVSGYRSSRCHRLSFYRHAFLQYFNNCGLA